ncbi:MAG: DUF4097 family beta strand repeat protein [Candidatus Aminicenantes bacterium]|nr:DUF4097 family beta strand repeat protein [Candidatus Aminicenantes bacterium]
MKNMSRKIQFSFIFLAAFAIFLTAQASGGIENNINKSFKVKPGGQLILETDIGSIEVKTAGNNTLKIEVIRNIRTTSSKRAESILEDLKFDFRQDGNTVYVNGEYDRSGLGKLFNNIGKYLRVKFLISVPQEFNVDLKTKGGSISIDDLKGKVQSKTSGGSLHFNHIQGPIWGRTSGGSIKLLSCTETADIKTSGGSITIGEVDGDVIAHTSGGSIKITRAKGKVDAHTSGGSIKVEEVMGIIKATTSGGSVSAYISKQPKSECSLKTSGGGITVYMAEGVGVNVDARASGGRVYTEYPVTIQGKINKTSLKAKMNGGGPELYLRTSGGSIRIKKR